jgi:hypothetical protein
MNNIGLCRKFDAMLRIYVNTGALSFSVANNPASASCSLGFALASSTFTNTCPFTINNIGSLVPANTTNISTGFFIARPPNFTLTTTGVNFNASSAGNMMNACRYYYSQVVIDTAKQIDYLTSNKAKNVLYRSFITNQFNNISGLYSALVQSGVTNILGLCIIPLISQSCTKTGFSQYISESV